MRDFAPLPFLGDFIAGRFVRPGPGGSRAVRDPGDLSSPVGRVSFSPSSVDAAVEAARRAFPAWRSLPVERRFSFLRRYKRLLLERGAGLAWVISRETGKPLAESEAEVRAMAEKVDATADRARALVADRIFPMPDGARAAVRHRPLGVMAVVGPFNVPGHLPNGQIVPALLAGNTVVFKPSERTPFTGQAMARLWAAAGLPRGTVNVVHGDGAAGGRLAGHPDVNGVFFTGSEATGRRVAALCAEDPSKLLALEMGGKNAALVLPDAPMEIAAREIVHGAFSTSGQRCSSTSRVLLHRRAVNSFLEAFLPAVDRLSVGYFTEKPSMGPLIDAEAAERFLKAQRTARRLGYRALRQGRALSLPRRGHYVGPSVHLLEGPPRFKERDYWDEELFAPDVALYVLRDEEEMIPAHNASRYGLAAAVFTRSAAAFRRLHPLLEAGVIHWNRATAMTPGVLPFGGVKASGNHRPAGIDVYRHCVAPVASVENPGDGKRKP